LAERVAVVSAAGSVTALAAIRSLGRGKVRVLAVHESRRGVGLRSRYAEARWCPDPEEAEQEFVEALLKLATSFEQRVPIVPTSDTHLRAIGRNSERLSAAFLFPFPVGEDLERIQRKRHQVERAAELGIDIPRTSDEATDEFGFPVLVKPSDPIGFAEAFGAKGFICKTLVEAEAAVERTRAFDPIVQEWIPGGDEQLFFLGAYLSQAGEDLGVFVGRKIRQVPEGIGTTRVGESIDAPMVAELGLAFLKGIGCHGLSDVEFKLDPRDGRYKLMEVNPRLGQWHGLATAAGVDLPLIAYRDLVGEPVRPARQSVQTKRWAITFLTGSGHERPGLGGNGPVVPKLPYTDAVFALDDPWPAAVQVGQIAKGLARRVTGSKA
jgi:predicted ATP-grasp superfamily ATP-dependent carboligase